MFVGEERQGGGQACKDDFIDLQLQALDDGDGVFEAIDVAVDDVDIHLDPRAVHADGIEDAALAIDVEMLADGVDDGVVDGQIDGLGVLDDVLDVLGGDLAVGGDDGMDAVVVEAADVVAGDAQIDAADFDVGHLLGLDDGVADVLLGQGGVGDFAFADAAGAGLAEADDVEGAGGVDLAGHDADFGGADFQADDDGGGIKHVSFWCERV